MNEVSDKYPLKTDWWGESTFSWALFGPEETEDGFYRYRYALGRRWDKAEDSLLFIMLNPSTADALQDDPTVRKCRKYAKKWGYGEVLVGNIFGLRSPDPDHLYQANNPVGPDNDHIIQNMLLPKADDVIVAWGNHGEHLDRSQEVLDSYLKQYDVQALELNKSGEPSHPLYLPNDTEPFSYEPEYVR